MDQALLIPIVLWGIFSFLLLLTPKISFGLKVIPIFLFGLYLYFWYANISVGISTILIADFQTFFIILYETLHLAVFSLFWLWPFCITLVFIIPDPIIKNTIIVTGFLFSIIIIGLYLSLSFISFSQG